MISPASIAADASLAVHAPCRTVSGSTTDGVTWVAAFIGTRAVFRAEAMLRRELLTHEQCQSLVDVAPTLTIWELRTYAEGVR
jgi:hypothetical protein